MIRPTAIDGLLVIERSTRTDERGFFREPFRLDELEAAAGGPVRFVQQNHARSRRGVLRGLHAENWEKLVYVPQGRVFVAVADIRPESATFGKVATFVLGSALAGLAGALYAHYQGTIAPQEFTFLEMVKMLLVVVLGGLGSITGCLFAAFLLLYVEQVLQLAGQETLPFGVPPLPASWSWLASWWSVVYALVLVLLMIFRPNGLLGSRELPDLLRGWFRRRPKDPAEAFR